MIDRAELRVSMNGYVMQLRTPELTSVALGVASSDASSTDALITLVEALQHLPVNDRAPCWELAVRRFGRQKELVRAAAEIGMDLLHARDLLDAYLQGMTTVRTAKRAAAGTG